METGEDVLAKLEERSQPQVPPAGIGVVGRTSIRGREVNLQRSDSFKDEPSKRSSRKVSFPDDDLLVSCVEAPDPWKNGQCLGQWLILVLVYSYWNNFVR